MSIVSFLKNIARPLKIACVGEAMVELSFSGANWNKPSLAFAGDTLNTAIYLKREIGDGAEISYVSALGRDEFSTRMMQFMADEGLKTDCIEIVEDKLPGLYAIMTDQKGERTFNYWRENSAARKMFHSSAGIDFSSLSGFDVIYFSAITLAILPIDVREAFLSYLAVVRAKGDCLVAFDSNFRPTLWSGTDEARFWIEKSWRLSDIALPSIDDEQALSGETLTEQTIDRLNGYGACFGALKRGEAGPLPLTPIGDLPEFGRAQNVVDTTAAGDSFNGAFLASILTGNDLVQALLAGHNCAKKTVGFAGALPEKAGTGFSSPPA